MESKALEALKEIREQLIYYKQYAKEVLPTKAQQIDEECEEELDIIENALGRLIELEDIFSETKSGEAVVVSAEKNEVLEIIKGGKIQIDFYPNDYVIHIILKDKTKVDLLKEVLL